jgi:hypothetical protein
MTGTRLLAVFALFVLPALTVAQPTYKLDVKPNLKPQATLQLDGSRIRRSAIKDDPGFRLQYHFKKDGKTIATVEARSQQMVELPQKDPGNYSVVLELFYPAYKGGAQQKGEFKPISNVLAYRIEPGAKMGDPVKIAVVEPPKLPPAK